MTEEDRMLLHRFIRLQEVKEKRKKSDWWSRASTLSTFVSGVLVASVALYINSSLQKSQLQTAADNNKAQIRLQQYKLATDLLPTLFDGNNPNHQIVAFSILQRSGPPEMQEQWRAVIQSVTTNPGAPGPVRQNAAVALATAVLVFEISEADDNLRVLRDDKEVMSWADNGAAPSRVLVDPGTHNFRVLVFNQRSYTGGLSGFGGHLPEGWRYRLTVKDANGRSLLALEDSEDHPDENGPRFGKEFQAARFTVDVNQAGVSVRDVQKRPS